MGSEIDLGPLLDLTPDGVVGVTADGEVRVVNEKAAELFGYTVQEMVGGTIESLLPNIFGTSLLGRRTVYMSDPKQRDMGTGLELFGRRHDGTQFPAELASTPHMMNGEQVVLLFVRDITARRLAEDAVVQREQQLSRIIDAALDAVLGMDAEGIITSWNPRAEQIFGWSRDEVIGKPMSEVIIPRRHREPHDEGRRRFLETGAARILGSRIEIQALHRHGHEFDVELAITAHDVGDSYVFYAFVTDITDRKNAKTLLERKVAERTAELAEAKAAAETANKAKSVFLSNMSHEIRTPMNAILGFGQLLHRDPNLGSEARDRVQMIMQSGDHLLGLIDNVLDMSKIEAGRTELVLETIDLHGTLETLEAMFRVRTETKGLELALSCNDDVPQYIRTDHQKLKQILINVIGNAVKFTERGGIALRVATADSGGDGLRLRFEIEDTGAGISENELDRVFEVFEQTESGRTSQTGTGLGMSISRDFARVMGGDLVVQSAVGKGSTFVLEFDAEPGAAKEVTAIIDRGLVIGLAEGHDVPLILVVDDKAPNRKLLHELLTSVGIRVEEAASGEESLRRFEEFEPDLVFMDVKMPGMDGLEATRRIRAMGRGTEVPIVALSASVFESEGTSVLESGANDFLRKPFRHEQIWEALERLLGLDFVRQEVVAPSDAAPLALQEVQLLPAESLVELRAAVESADLDLFLSRLDVVADGHPAVVAGLRDLAKAFDFDKLLELL